MFYGDNNLRWKENHPLEVSTGESQAFPAWAFRHFDYETLPIVATAINESMLQSAGDSLLVFPALLPQEEVSFRLFGEGGFCVEAVKDRNSFRINVTSDPAGAGELRLVLPPWAVKCHGQLLRGETSTMVECLDGRATAFAIALRGARLIVTGAVQSD